MTPVARTLTPEETDSVLRAIVGHIEFNLRPEHVWGNYRTNAQEKLAERNMAAVSAAYVRVARTLEAGADLAELPLADRRRVSIACEARLDWEGDAEDRRLCAKVDAAAKPKHAPKKVSA